MNIQFPIDIMNHIIKCYLRGDKEFLKGFHSLSLISKKINAYMQKYAEIFNEQYQRIHFYKDRGSERYKVLLNGNRHGEYIKDKTLGIR